MKPDKLISVMNIGRIPTLLQDGPIIHPMNVGSAIASSLVMSGFTVYEHNQYNPSEKILLTMANFNDDSKFLTPAPVEPVSAPAVGFDVPTVTVSDPEQAQEPVVEVPVVSEAKAEEPEDNKALSWRDRAIAAGIDPDAANVSTKAKLKSAVLEAEANMAK